MFMGIPMMMHSDTPETDRRVGLGSSSVTEIRLIRVGALITADGVLLSEVRGVKEVVRCLLEGRQHEDALLHFG